MGVEQRGVRDGVEQEGAGQHLLVRGDGLPVRPRPGGLAGDGGPVANDGRVVAGLDGVVQDARQVRRRPGEQRGGDPGVAVEPDGDRQRLHHGPAGQLVAERDGAGTDLQHTDALGLGDGAEIRAERAQQRLLDLRGDDRQLLDDLPRGGSQPVHAGQDGVDDGPRHRVVR